MGIVNSTPENWGTLFSLQNVVGYSTSVQGAKQRNLGTTIKAGESTLDYFVVAATGVSTAP